MSQPNRHAGKGLQFPPAGIDGRLLAGADTLSTDPASDLLEASKITLDLLPKAFRKALPGHLGERLDGWLDQTLPGPFLDLLHTGIPGAGDHATGGLIGCQTRGLASVAHVLVKHLLIDIPRDGLCCRAIPRKSGQPFATIRIGYLAHQGRPSRHERRP